MKTANDNFLTLPAWFPADKAGAVLRNKGKRFALITDGNGWASVADVRQLAVAPSTKSVSFCARPLGPAVAATASFDEAIRLMDTHHKAYLPMVVSGVIVGIVARDLARGSATDPANDTTGPQAAEKVAA